MPMYTKLPPNLCGAFRNDDQTIYFRDYCSRFQRKKKPPLIRASLTKTFDKENQRKDKESTKRKGKDAFVELYDHMQSLKLKEGVTENGLKGAERAMHDGKTPEQHHDAVLPALNDWFSSANDHEKDIVYDFMSRIARYPKSTMGNELRPRTSPSNISGDSHLVGNDLPKSVRINSAPLPTPLPSSPLMRETLSTKTVMKSLPSDLYLNENKDHLGSMGRGNRSLSPITNLSSPSSAGSSPTSPCQQRFPELSHSPSGTRARSSCCRHCKICNKRLGKRESRSETNGKYFRPKTSPPVGKSYVYGQLDDSTNDSSAFQNVKSLTRRDFVIHPDLVSENIRLYSRKNKNVLL